MKPRQYRLLHQGEFRDELLHLALMSMNLNIDKVKTKLCHTKSTSFTRLPQDCPYPEDILLLTKQLSSPVIQSLTFCVTWLATR